MEAIRKFGLPYTETGSHESFLKCPNLTIHFNTVQKIISDVSKEVVIPESLEDYGDAEADNEALEKAAKKIKMNQLNELYPSDLIIVDEVHHSAAPSYRKIYGINAKQKMGLSATIDDSSGVKLSILKKELGSVVYQFGLKEAMDSGILPKFKWDYNVIYLDTSENLEFEELTKIILTLFININENPIKILDISKKMEAYCTDKKNKMTFPQRYQNKSSFSNLGDFIDFCTFARSCKIKLHEDWIKLDIHIFKRREIIHNSKPKLEEATKKAEEYLKAGKKIIMFLKRTDSCDEIAETLRNHGHREVFVVHSKISKYEQNLDAFKKEKSGILIGANILNEGLDIPDAEIGINVSSSKTKLELIQRIGRVIRNKPGKNPIFVHYDAIPQFIDYEGFDKNLLSYIQDISLAEDIAWSQETALNLNIDLVVNDTNSNDLKRMEQHIEKSFKNNLVHSDDAFNVEFETTLGPLKLAQILKPFYEGDEPYLALVDHLDKLGKREISDSEWFSFIRNSFSKKEGESLSLPGHYWILLLGGRNPSKIIKILKKDTSFVAVDSILDVSGALKTSNQELNVCSNENMESELVEIPYVCGESITVQKITSNDVKSNEIDSDIPFYNYENEVRRLNVAIKRNTAKIIEEKKAKGGKTSTYYIARFEDLTGAKVIDSIVEIDRIVNVIQQGDMALAIGKGGENITRVKNEIG
jgi:DNA or RNA helicases of superfamily II